MRIYACHAGDASHPVGPRVAAMRDREVAEGITSLPRYRAFAEQVQATKRDLLRFLSEAKAAGKTVVGYGALAKGNTLLNFCGIRTDFLDYTVDISPHKHGRLLPGTRIPIHPPEKIFETRPDYVLILAWNIKDEIMQNMAAVRDWGGRFVVPLPEVALLDRCRRAAGRRRAPDAARRGRRAAMHALIARLYPICRSITGDGVRETLRILQERLPLAIREVPTGTAVFDWTVPQEWNIRDAYVQDSRGQRVIDFRAHNLHVLNYSTPVRARMSPRRAPAAPLRRPGPPRLDPLPHQLLPGELGLLPAAAPSSRRCPRTTTRW